MKQITKHLAHLYDGIQQFNHLGTPHLNQMVTPHLMRNLITILLLALTFLFSSCDMMHQPVRGYFEEWTSEVSIQKFEVEGVETYYDKNGNLCIPSDHDAQVTFFMVNPYHYDYYNNSEYSGKIEGISVQGQNIEADPNDTTLLHMTYPKGFLEGAEGGQEIGGEIFLPHPRNPTKKAFSFSLKCNSKPPEVIGQTVMVMVMDSNSKYVICFYLPTVALGSATHNKDTHTIYIDNTPIATGNASELIAASASSATLNLARLSNGATFDSTPPSSDYSPFYYVTDRVMHENDNISWNIRIEDDDGLSSLTRKASTIVSEAHLTVSGEEEVVLTTNSGDNAVNASVDEGSVQSWSWVSNNTNIATVSSTDADNATITPVAGGTTTIDITANLTDGRVVRASKTIRVLDISLGGNTSESMIVNGDDGDLSITATAAGFPSSPTYTWSSTDPSVATVDSTGTVTAVAHGTANITVSAQYGGKTVTSSAKTINVYEVSAIMGDSVGFVGSSNAFNVEVIATGPNGQSPSPWSQNWTSTNTSVAPNPATTNTNARKITPTSGGTTNIKVVVTINGKKATRQKTLTIYDLVVSGKTLLSQTGTNSNLTLTPSLKAGSTTYSGSVTYSYSAGIGTNATVNNSGIVTAKSTGSGSQDITVTANVNGKTLTKTHTVQVISVSGTTNFIAGESARKLTFTDIPTGYSYTWSSNYPSRTSVNSSTGYITAITEGSANITLTVTKTGGSESLAIVTPVTTYSLSIVGNTLYDKTAGAKTFTASLKNGDTTYSGSDISYSWSSGTAATATISSTTGSMTPKAGGSTVISLTAKRNGTTVKTVTKTIYVIEVKGCTNFIVGGSARALTVVPASISDVTYTWSDNSTLVSVDESNGKITANSDGTATIKLTAKKGSETINVNTSITLSKLSLSSPMTVISGTTINIAVGEEFSVTKALSPNFTYSSMTCTSSNSNIAAVDNNFKITGKAQGSSSITVSFTMSDNTVLTKENAFTVNVLQYHTVSSKDALNSFLSNMPANTNGTPYKIKITTLSPSDVYQGPDATYAVEGTLRKILQTNSTKYVDLSEVTLPVVEDMSRIFLQCSTLVKPPRIPNGVTNLSHAFNSCSNLKTAPSIPSGVTSLFCTFDSCANLETAPSSIPSTVTYMVRTFSGCRKLQSVPTIPEGVTNMNYCFYDCDSLNQDMVLPSTLEELVGVFQSSGLNGKTISVKADFYGLNGAGTDKWEDAFAGVASVNVWVASQEAGDACSNAPGWNEATMEIAGILP